METLLAALLDCGVCDVGILDDCQYDLGEIVENLKWEGVDITLNVLTDSIFYKGQQELVDAIEEFVKNKTQDLQELKEYSDELNCDRDSIQSEIDNLEDNAENEEKLGELQEQLDEIDEKINDLDSEIEELEEAVDSVETLNPEEDMEWFCNCLDTSCWFRSNEDIYKKYLEKEVDRIEENMGFSF